MKTNLNAKLEYMYGKIGVYIFAEQKSVGAAE